MGIESNPKENRKKESVVTQVIKIGDTLILEPMDTDSPVRYKCRIVEYNEKELYIDYPIHLETNKTVFLINGTQLRGSFVTNEGISYMFDTEIIGRLNQNIPMLVLPFPEKDQIIKIQRRRYVRVAASVDIAIHPISDEYRPFTAATIDISAGGAAILVPNSIRAAEDMLAELILVLPLQNGEYYYPKLKGNVIRVLEFNEMYNKLIIEFVDVSPKNRQLLLRYCYDIQLSYKKKGIDL